MEAISDQPAIPPSVRPERAAAYEQTRQALLANPTDIVAWLQLSKLIDDPQQQRECFERVLILDPHNGNARDGLERLRLKDLLATFASARDMPPEPSPQQLGAYLVAKGRITPVQLNAALIAQRERKAQGVRVPLGELLLAAGSITPQVLAAALVDQLPAQPRGLYFRLGAYLVAEGVITRQQLETALAEQLVLKQRGQQVPLGELLLRTGAVRQSDLARLLERQHSEFNSCFGD